MRRCVVRFSQENRLSFDMVREGRKTIETRAGSPRYKDVAVGDTLVFICGSERFEKVVKRVFRADSPETYLELVDYRTVRPDAGSAEDTIAMWYQFPGYRERIAQFGLIGFAV